MDGRHLAYRPDIDGLRAIAITTVIASHAFPGAFPGGFVGVDIFFVISGFLITSILKLEIAESRFSITAFYARRVRRLFPALVVVLAATLLVGWAILLEDEYRALGWHVSAGAGFVSNIALWSEAGYFDIEAELKPLLNLWSLGVEEQFYFVWPLIIAIAIKARLRLLVVAGLLALLSFASNLAMVETDRSGAFFLPYPRFWELMLGGMLAAGAVTSTGRTRAAPSPPPRRHTLILLREAAALLGVSVIGIAVMILNAKRDFPGWWALLPALGSVVLIGIGRQSWIGRRLLSHKLLVYIGLISYPLYLWHWPLLSFARIVYAGTPSLEVRMALVATAFILADATYRYVELPLRTLAKKPSRFTPVSANLGAAMLAVFLAGLTVNQGVPKERLHESSLILSEARRDWNYPGDGKASLKGTLNERVLFFGDSYVQQLYPRIDFIAEQKLLQRTAIFHTSAGCAPIPGIARKSDPSCAAYSERGFKLAAAPDVRAVVIAGSWLGMLGRGDYYEIADPRARIIDFTDAKALERILRRLEVELATLHSLGKVVYVVLNPPGGGRADPGNLEEGRWGSGKHADVRSITTSEHLRRTGDINARIRSVAERRGVTVIDPAEWICSGGKCNFTDPDGIPRYKDSTHFRASFVRCCIKDFDLLVAPDAPHPIVHRHNGAVGIVR